MFSKIMIAKYAAGCDPKGDTALSTGAIAAIRSGSARQAMRLGRGLIVAFGDIVQGSLQDFVNANRFDTELCVFIHIPKTAGSSLSTELDRMRPPYHNIHRNTSTVTPSRFRALRMKSQR